MSNIAQLGFFNYSPHTSEIRVRYYPQGWDVDHDEVEEV